jgi:hypothetical protein
VSSDGTCTSSDAATYSAHLKTESPGWTEALKLARSIQLQWRSVLTPDHLRRVLGIVLTFGNLSMQEACILLLGLGFLTVSLPVVLGRRLSAPFMSIRP